MSILRFAHMAWVLSLLFIAQQAFAFRSTDIEGYTDPDYKEYHPKKVLVMVLNADHEQRKQIEERLIESFSDFGVQAVPERSLFPPTRDWTPEARNAMLKENEI